MEKLLQKINKTDTCWEWTGSLNKKGYGEVSFNGKNSKAHRVVYILSKGEIGKGLEIDHLCRNRKCVNPDHLEAVTHTENMRRSLPFKPVRTHCLKGHELVGKNIFVNKRKDGYNDKVCRTCKNEYMKKYMRENVYSKKLQAL